MSELIEEFRVNLNLHHLKIKSFWRLEVLGSNVNCKRAMIYLINVRKADEKVSEETLIYMALEKVHLQGKRQKEQ